MPLFKDFTQDDWSMMTLRFELHLLAHAFRKDVNDADRSGIHLDHLDFYYKKYYKKGLTAKSFGVSTLKEVTDLVNNVVFVSDKNVLESQLVEDMENYQIFVMLTEQERRDRNVRLDLGDETAKLKISHQSQDNQSQGNQNWDNNK